MSERPRPPSLMVPCIRLSPDLDRQIRAQRLGAERYSDTVRRVLRLGLRVATPPAQEGGEADSGTGAT